MGCSEPITVSLENVNDTAAALAWVVQIVSRPPDQYFGRVTPDMAYGEDAGRIGFRPNHWQPARRGLGPGR